MLEYKKQLLLFLVIVGYSFPCFTLAEAPKWRTAYYANQYSDPASLAYLPLAEVPWKKYTHVIQSAILPTAVNGLPGLNTGGYGIGSGPGSNAEEFVSLAHENGVKALVSIVVGKGQAADMENNTNGFNLSSFVSLLSDFITSNNYDGIDVDWESNVSVENYRIQFPEFIRALREAMPTKVITVAGSLQYRSIYAALYNDGSGRRVYDNVDQINLMLYDMDGSVYNGQSSPRTWFNTSVRRNSRWPFNSSTNNYGNNKTQEGYLKYVLESAQIPAAKVGLGVPFYGYIRQAPFSDTDGVTLPRQLYAPTGPTPDYRIQIAYRQLVTPVLRPDGTVQTRTLTNAWVPYYWGAGVRLWSDIYKAPYISYNVADPTEDAFVTYTDPQQIGESVKLIDERGLGGIMVFALGHEYLASQTGDNRYPLSTAVFNDMLALGNVDSGSINVAYGKKAKQSSTFQSAAASLAVDGNSDGNYWNGSVSRTNDHESSAWWEIDLQGVYNINQIKVWNRTDCCMDHLQPFSVSIFNTNRAIVWSSAQSTYPNPSSLLSPDGQYGRYVRISGPEDSLSLAEVQLYSKLNNVALGKPAMQSSTFKSAAASLAVDGNSDGNYWNGSVSSTDGQESSAWWKVDLQGTFNIGQIKISNRTDCCLDQLSNYFIDIIDERDNVVWSNFQVAVPNPDVTLVPGGVAGRYVKIYGPSVLSLSEVEVIEY